MYNNDSVKSLTDLEMSDELFERGLDQGLRLIVWLLYFGQLSGFGDDRSHILTRLETRRL